MSLSNIISTAAFIRCNDYFSHSDFKTLSFSVLPCLMKTLNLYAKRSEIAMFGQAYQAANKLQAHLLFPSDLVIILPNVGPDGVISLQEVSQMMESVQRCQSLEDTRDLYDRGEFSKVVENLMASFNEKVILLGLQNFFQNEFFSLKNP